MINRGKFPILGVLISAVDYEYAVQEVMAAAHGFRSLTVSALAVHGVMTGYRDTVHRRRLNGLDLVVPDGQPVRWGLNWIHHTNLNDRVYGPNLTLEILGDCEKYGMPVYFYGSTNETLDRLRLSLLERFPRLRIGGAQASKFRRIGEEEKEAIVQDIIRSGARVVFVGLGCPRQEMWVYEYRHALNMPLIAVGAAFDFHAGIQKQAPAWMQKRGLEWLFRLTQEPKRLWKRYVLLNPWYLFRLFIEVLGIRVSVVMPTGDEPEECFG